MAGKREKTAGILESWRSKHNLNGMLSATVPSNEQTTDSSLKILFLQALQFAFDGQVNDSLLFVSEIG